MKKGETFFDRILFTVMMVFKMIVPPVYSLERLERYCKSRIKINPRAYSPRWFLAGAYKDYQRYEAAKQEYFAIRDLGYMSDSDILDLSAVLFALKDIHAVIENLEPIIDKYPHHRDAHWYLGVCYMEREKFEEASHHLEKVMRARKRWWVGYLKPRFWVARGQETVEKWTDVYSKGGYKDYWRLGFCYERLGQLEKARDAYSRALLLKPDSIEVRRNLASVYLRIGQSLLPINPEGAEREVRRTFDLDPANRDAVELLEKIDRLKKQRSLN